MYIHEAVSAAIAEGKYIRRTVPPIWSRCKVKPTNSPDCCYLVAEKQAPHRGWQPTAEDLSANDWVLVDG